MDRMTRHLDHVDSSMLNPVVKGRSTHIDTQATAAFMAASQRIPSVFTLADEEVRILDALELVYGAEVDPADTEAIERREDAITYLQDEFEQNAALVIRKTEGYLRLLAHLSAMEEARKAHAARLRASAAVYEKAQADVKRRLMTAMQIMERERIETPIGTVRIQDSPLSVNVVDASAVPHEYERTKITVEVDKVSILRDVKAGAAVPPGVTIERGQHLRLS